MDSMFISVSGTTTSTVSTTAATKIHCVCSATPCSSAAMASTCWRSSWSSWAMSFSTSATSAMALPLMRLAVVAVS